MKRAVVVIFKDAEMLLPISKATAVRTVKNMLHFDQLDDGTWRIIYNENMIPDFSKIVRFEIRREDV